MSRVFGWVLSLGFVGRLNECWFGCRLLDNKSMQEGSEGFFWVFGDEGFLYDEGSRGFFLAECSNP